MNESNKHFPDNPDIAGDLLVSTEEPIIADSEPSSSVPEKETVTLSDEEQFQEQLAQTRRRYIALAKMNCEKAECNPEYVFYPDEAARRQLFEFCQAIAEYMHDNQVADIIIADRSARPLYTGLKEYWEKTYQDEKRPGIFFVNPKGFLTSDTITEEKLKKDQNKAKLTGDNMDPPETKNRNKTDIMNEFAESYGMLMADRDKTILLFDTCIHSGNNIKPVKDILEEMGFSNLIIGASHPADEGSSVREDFHIIEDFPVRMCQPFGEERLVGKNYDHVHSKTNNRDIYTRRLSKILRKEIKKIINDYIEQDRISQTS